MDLVEREPALSTLRSCLRSAARQGAIALVAGEAGIGKTSLLRALGEGQPAVWWGACDALQTPHPLAPLQDIAAQARPRFAAALHGPRPQLFAAVLDEMRAAPLLVVVEDAHWADGATLDLLKFIGRRIERTRALLAISFRDDEVGATHPLRQLLGELPSAALTRVELSRLSSQGVEALARRAARPWAGVFEATRGNPFFVTEVLRDSTAGVPRTVQDLVLARFARLPEAAREVVRAVSLVPPRAERWLIDALLAPPLADVQTGIDGGLLLADETSLCFRHELARVAVESSLSPPAAQVWHARMLRAFDEADRAVAAARRVHHARGAGDAAAMTRWAPQAAEEARERGAHRQAAAQWRSALQHGAPADEAERQRWLEGLALECQTIGQLDEAIAAREALGRSYAGSGEVRLQARNLSRSALVHVLALRNAQADADSHRAIGLLAPLPPCVEQAHAFWVQAQLRMLDRDCVESADWSRKAIELATRFGDREIEAAALGTLGTATLFFDAPSGVEHLERALDLALRAGLHWVAANSYSNLGSASGELFRLHEARRWLDRAVQFATEHEIDFYRHYATAWRALCALYLGEWDAAAESAGEALSSSGATTTGRVMALVALGRLRVRRGDPGADAALDAALELAQASGTLQRIAPVRAARAEAAFMRGDAAAADAEAAAALPLAVRHGHPWFIGELAFWRWRAGALAEPPACCAEPAALQIAGRWREAAGAWQRLACPYERARALADGDADAQREALGVFESLGARPAAEALRRRLREAGVRGVARGARESTRSHPCALTDAEWRVLELLARELRNADIATRLHRSVRTVDHHVAAVLAKLGAGSRIEAVRRARREGWLPTPAQSGQGGGAI